jgi:hypothetical protein
MGAIPEGKWIPAVSAAGSLPKLRDGASIRVNVSKGVYVIGTGSHAVCVIDGDWYDSWDSGGEVCSYYWKKEDYR